METSPKLSRSSRHSLESKKSKTSDNEEGKEKQEGESSPARCPICLAMPENKAKSGACSHYFCYSCLKEWSKVKAECPLCKMPIRTIFFNIRSDREYEEYHVKQPRPDHHMSSMHHESMVDFESFDNWWHFRMREYRNQLRRRRENELAAMQACSDIAVIRKRRMYYWHKTKVSTVNTGRRVRDISPEFFEENPSQMHRLEPWLKRELTVLYGAHNRLLINRVRDVIIAAIPTYGITSDEFRQRIHPYLLDHTEQFIHEFIAFAKSPYTVQQYDRHAVYPIHPDSADPQRRQNDPGSGSSRQHRRLSRNPLRSRWEESPETTGQFPGTQTSQSVMLSQTTWGDDLAPMYPGMTHPRVSLPTVPMIDTRAVGPSDTTPPIESIEYRNPTPPPRFNVTSVQSETNVYSSLIRSLPQTRIHHRSFHYRSTQNADVEAPLVHQTLPHSRHHHSSERSHRRMELMRRHFDRYTIDRRFDQVQHLRRTRWLRSIETTPTVPSQSNQPEVIVISSDTSDDENKAIVVDDNVSQTLHYRPSVQQRNIKEEKTADSMDTDSSSSSSSSDESEVKFIKYIKPPHLRTPEAYINLDSDDDEPGPSNRNYDVTRRKNVAIVKSYSSSSELSSSEEERIPAKRSKRSRMPRIGQCTRNLIERTKDFLNKASSSHDSDVINIHNDVTNDGERSPLALLQTMVNDNDATSVLPIMTSSNAMTSPDVDVTSEFISSPLRAENTSENNFMTSQSQEKQKSPVKKIFERRKVSINFQGHKYLDDSFDSDYEIDVVTEPTNTFNPRIPSIELTKDNTSGSQFKEASNVSSLAEQNSNIVGPSTNEKVYKLWREFDPIEVDELKIETPSKYRKRRHKRSSSHGCSRRKKRKHHRRRRSHHEHRSRDERPPNDVKLEITKIEDSKDFDLNPETKRSHKSGRHKKLPKKHKKSSRSSSVEIVSYVKKT